MSVLILNFEYVPVGMCFLKVEYVRNFLKFSKRQNVNFLKKFETKNCIETSQSSHRN